MVAADKGKAGTMNGEIDQMREMIARLNAAAKAYYSGRGELMTDFEWDALFDKLKALEEATGVVLEGSPTHNVSSEGEGAAGADAKERHEFPALSLAKTKQTADVAKWAEGRPIWLSWKLDGLTLVATYDGGRLSRIVTRGDGAVGTNITRLASGIQALPLAIKDTGHVVVRGEAVITYADFEAFRSTAGGDWANPRNLASGSLTLKDVEEFRRRNVRFVAFTPVKFEDLEGSWGRRMADLEAQGFKVVEREFIAVPTKENIDEVISRWSDKVAKGACPFPVDGLVVCYDDVAYAQTGSVTGHHAVRAGLAFKWADETASTILDHIEWSCAVNVISPVAVFEPVQLEGTQVKRASLCNISECERLGIGGKGTKIEVIKANKIIPKVVSVAEKAGEFELPAACPVCAAPVEVATSASLTKTLRCTNPHCPARELRLFERFVSKDGLDIDGLAGETIEKFINRGWLKTRADIYRLGAHRDEIAAMDGFGEKSAANIVAAIEKARKRDAVNFLVALAIPQCGPDAAKRLLAVYPLKDFVARAALARPDEFASIDGIGEVTSESIVAWFANAANKALVEDLLSQIEIVDYVPPSKEGRCAGLSFVVTGDLATWPNRNALKAYIEKEGGKVAGSVSAKTSFLINNDATSNSSKNKKARELSIPVITEAQFNERFNSPES